MPPPPTSHTNPTPPCHSRIPPHPCSSATPHTTIISSHKRIGAYKHPLDQMKSLKLDSFVESKGGPSNVHPITHISTTSQPRPQPIVHTHTLTLSIPSHPTSPHPYLPLPNSLFLALPNYLRQQLIGQLKHTQVNSFLLRRPRVRFQVVVKHHVRHKLAAILFHQRPRIRQRDPVRVHADHRCEQILRQRYAVRISVRPQAVVLLGGCLVAVVSTRVHSVPVKIPPPAVCCLLHPLRFLTTLGTTLPPSASSHVGSPSVRRVRTVPQPPTPVHPPPPVVRRVWAIS